MKAARWTVKRDVVAQLARQPMTKAQLCEATGLRDSQVQNVLSRLLAGGQAERTRLPKTQRSRYRLLVPAITASHQRDSVVVREQETSANYVESLRTSSLPMPTWPAANAADQSLGGSYRKPSEPRWRIAA